MERLRFVSQIAAYDVPDDATPHRAAIDGLQVSEEWMRHDDSGLPQGVKAYRIALEAQVSTLAEVRDAWGRASDLSSDLDQVWPYVAGEPLLPVVLTIRLGDDPDGWSSNFRELEKHFARASGAPLAYGEVINRHWMKMPTPPLRSALEARSRLGSLTGAQKLLHGLHYSSQKATDLNAQVFTLAKCLEIVRHLLPGRNDTQRHKSLHPTIQQSITHSLHDLFGLANNRLDVRHAVKNPIGPTFHPEMTSRERASFVHDANTIVRGVVCDHRRMPPFQVQPYSKLVT